MTSIRLDHLSKHFGPTTALDNVSLTIPAGEIFFLLGPSGCGKSTLLRILAGLQTPDSGHVFFNDRDVTSLSTDQRDAVMVFQSYALWPHLTVAQNVAFGLDVRGTRGSSQKSRVSQVLDLVHMTPYADRRPSQLSGGQQQRVALARALAVKPACILLDEPLSNLDAQLRVEMRSEIRHVCKSAGLTAIYVTHDQKEAMSVADRIAVLRAGRLEQVGTPRELYSQPASPFVAAFMGPTNLLPGVVRSSNGSTATIDTTAGPIRTSSAPAAGTPVTLSIRPENIRFLTPPAAAENEFSSASVESIYLGDTSEHDITLAGGIKLRAVSSPPRWGLSADVRFGFNAADVVVLPKD